MRRKVSAKSHTLLWKEKDGRGGQGKSDGYSEDEPGPLAVRLEIDPFALCVLGLVVDVGGASFSVIVDGLLVPFGGLPPPPPLAALPVLTSRSAFAPKLIRLAKGVAGVGSGVLPSSSSMADSSMLSLPAVPYESRRLLYDPNGEA